jgi:serine/threonine protein kinase
MHVAGDPSSLFKLLTEYELLKPALMAEARQYLPCCADARAFAAELIRREWITPFQANKVLQGKPRELVVGPYRIQERLGEGGMGEVFKARHARMERTVALKVISRDKLDNPTAVERFNREVKAVAQLTHPNIVCAFDCGEDEGLHYLAMEYVDGPDLAKQVKQNGPLRVREACEYTRQAALGLQHAHEKGLVHRDIKPANLLLQRDTGLIKVLDFGLARFASERKTAGHLTQIGRLVGTVDYISPEQAGDARKADIRSDIYSLGCCCFYLLTGKPPFEGEDLVSRIAARALNDAPLLRTRRADAPSGLEQIVARMLERDPRRRYSTPLEVAVALQPFASVVPMEARAVKEAPVNARAANRPQVVLEPPPRTMEGTPLIVRRTESRGGSWGWAILACTIILLFGGGLAFWLLKKTPTPATIEESPRLLASTDPKPKTAIVPKKPGDPKDPLKSPIPLHESPLPKQIVDIKVAPPAVAANETELIPPPARIVAARPEPNNKPPDVKPQDPRGPVPTGEALTKAETVIRDLYKDDYSHVKQSELAAFAERLLEQAGEVKRDPVLRYVYLRDARDVAARAAEAALAMKAIDELSKDYAVNGRDMRVAAFERSVSVVQAGDRAARLCDLVTDAIDQSLATESFDEALRLARFAESAAYRSQEAALINATLARRREVETLKQGYEDVKPALAKLDENPDDSEANLAVGKFRCLLKGDWAQGLANLVQGGEGKLQDLARREAGGVEKAEQMVELADAWRDCARTERGTTRNNILRHALALYQQAVTDLTAIAKTKVEKNIAEIEKELPKERASSNPLAKFKGRWYIEFSDNSLRDYAVNANGDVLYVAHWR